MEGAWGAGGGAHPLSQLDESVDFLKSTRSHRGSYGGLPLGLDHVYDATAQREHERSKGEQDEGAVATEADRQLLQANSATGIGGGTWSRGDVGHPK